MTYQTTSVIIKAIFAPLVGSLSFCGLAAFYVSASRADFRCGADEDVDRRVVLKSSSHPCFCPELTIPRASPPSTPLTGSPWCQCLCGNFIPEQGTFFEELCGSRHRNQGFVVVPGYFIGPHLLLGRRYFLMGSPSLKDFHWSSFWGLRSTQTEFLAVRDTFRRRSQSVW